MNRHRLTTAIALMTVSCLARGPTVLATHAQLSIGGTLQLAPIEEVQAVLTCGDEKNTIPQIGMVMCAVVVTDLAPEPVIKSRIGRAELRFNPSMVTVTPVACATGDRRVADLEAGAVTMLSALSVALNEGSVAPDDGVYRGGPM